MARISEIPKATIQITEQTIFELARAVRDTHATQNPLPDCIMVTSDYGQVEFQIQLELRRQSQESLGYRKTKDIHFNQSGNLDESNKMPHDTKAWNFGSENCDCNCNCDK